MAEFDYAIVGAGSAGCVLAHRLSGGGKKVALIEAGPPAHRSFKVRAPGMYQALWRTPLDWGLSTQPQAHSDNRRHYWPRGKVLGGTSCLNAMVYIRGHRDNYDAWRDAGNPGWGWDDVLPYFKRSEDNARGASAHHGAGGLLHVSDFEPAEFSRAFVAATAARCKVRAVDDFNTGDPEGAGLYQRTVKGGYRASTAVAFLDPIRDRDNLTVISEALATGLIVDGDDVKGVRLGDREIRARETILCGGAIGSPHLLLLSGIGPADELRAAGIEPRHDLAGVGKHLEDHLLAVVEHDVDTGARSLTRGNFALWALRHLFGGGGPLGVGPVEAGAFVRSKPDVPRPDVQYHVVPWGLEVPTDDAVVLPFGRRVSMLPGLIYPKSHGEIRLASKDPTAAPAIDPRYFSDPADLDHLVAGIELTREIAATEPLAKMLGAERRPGPDVRTREQIRAYVRATCNTIFHPVGTCRMGTGKDCVVDPELRVHGLRGLRVADASIMPRIIGGNTNAPAIMIAEKCADLMMGA